jgi:hypothetical protein
LRVNVLQSWPRQFMKKWLTFRATGDEFKCEDDIRCGHDAEDNSNSDEFEEDYVSEAGDPGTPAELDPDSDDALSSAGRNPF